MIVRGKKILVTGHNGFIGKKLVKTLKHYDNEVITLEKGAGKRLDIRDWNEIKKFEDFNIIYHLAAVTFVPYSFKNPRKTYDVNIRGTLNILELGRLVDVEQIVTMSSYVYGSPKYLPIDENHPTNPNNPYTHSKLIIEQLCEAYSRDFGMNCVLFRPFNIYGPGQDENFLIPSIINQLRTGIIELKDPEPKRDFIYVSDVIDALLKVSKLKNNKPHIFNIGSGKSYSVKEIVDKIVQLSETQTQITYTGERRKNEIMDTVADITKIKDELGWEPLYDMNKGLSEILNKND